MSHQARGEPVGLTLAERSRINYVIEERRIAAQRAADLAYRRRVAASDYTGCRQITGGTCWRNYPCGGRTKISWCVRGTCYDARNAWVARYKCRPVSTNIAGR